MNDFDNVTARHGSRLTQEVLRFTFDGREYAARGGDTAASALLANGVHAFGRSVKYRRLRGVLAAGPEDPTALLTVGNAPAIIPNVPAACVRLQDGMVLRSQNRWPGLHWDLASLLQSGAGLLGAGFYYKTFMWPSWRTYEPLIRALAGLGEAPGVSDLPEARVEYLGCDVLVAGAGPAGLAAALAATRMGAKVLVVEREPIAGGELEFETATIDAKTGADWLEAACAELASHGVRMCTDTTLVGGTGGLYVAHCEPGGIAGANEIYKIRPRAVVLAHGAVERPIAFVDNDRPGVMLLGAAERFTARYGALRGRTAVLFANHDRVYAAAERLLAAGVQIKAVIDSRAQRAVSENAETRRARLIAAGVTCLTSHAVTAAVGHRRVHGAEIARLDVPATRRTIDCDLICTSGGWSPSMQPAVRGERTCASAQATFIAGLQPAGRFITGAAQGLFWLPDVLAAATADGAAAARHAGHEGPAPPVPEASADDAPGLEPYWRAPCALRDEQRQFVDLQNDVTVADLRAALAEGFSDIEHVKRYTTLGVGTEQGATSSTLGAAIVAELRGQPLDAVGVSRPRPPHRPVSLHALAGWRRGPALRVTRRTPLNAWHADHGGALVPTGLWLRPRYYRTNGADAFAAAVAEARRVRAEGGIVDGSTLGKLEIAGPDAAAFLDTLYLSRASTIRSGRARYMVNLREDGIVLDDGLVLRMGPERFIATTSSGHAGHMLSHFEHYRETQWAARRVTITDVTDAWAVIVVAGPQSRATLLRVLGPGWHDALSSLAHMELAQGDFQGSNLTVLRASFSGELAYELHVRPAGASGLWQLLVDAGLAPYGLDAMDILRVEKGYLTSSEINGETTPLDLNMEPMLRLANPCVGHELLQRPAFSEPNRPHLVGLQAADGQSVFEAGAQLTFGTESKRPCGYVTSAAYSPLLERWVGLGLVARSLSDDGNLLQARDPLRGRTTTVRVCPPVHVDPAGERMRS